MILQDNWLRYFLILMVGIFLKNNPLYAQDNNNEPDSKRPNILFCMADDWGWPHAGAYGDEVVQTPHFDRVAEDGVLFSHAFISSPSCTPSRNAMITGQQFYRLEEGANLWSTLDDKFPNFMMMLEKSGYRIGHHSKAWGPGDYTAAGYDRNPTGPEVNFQDFMDQQSDDQPFCFWLGTSDPHRGYDGFGDVPYQEVEVPGWYPDVDSVKKDIASYYFEVQRWDQKVGKALATLEAKGALDNTIVVVTGDHGWPFPRGKGNLYDYGARVPLAIMWGDQIKGDRQVNDFVSLTDLAPTFLEAAGLNVPVQMTGKSLLPVLRSEEEGRVDPSRNFVVTGRERHVLAQKAPWPTGYPSRAIRTDGWLYIMNLKPDRWPAGVPENATHSADWAYPDCDNGMTKSFIINNKDKDKYRRYYELSFMPRPHEELYNVKEDPGQVNNLAGDDAYNKVVAALRNKLINYLRKTEDPRFTDLPVQFADYTYRGNWGDASHRQKMEEMREKQLKSKNLQTPFD